MLRRSALVIAALGVAASAVGAAPAQASTRGIVTGTVTDAGGSPVVGAVVRYHALDGDHEEVSTDRHGVYRVRVKAPVHAYLDVFTAAPYPAWTSGDITFEARATVVRDVRLTAAGVPTLLYGRVTDARTGRPVPRLRISSLIHEGDNDSEVVTDRDGRYAFAEFDAQGEGYHPLSGAFVYDLFTEATGRYAGVSFTEGDPAAAGPGVLVSEGQRVRFDFAVPRRP